MYLSVQVPSNEVFRFWLIVYASVKVLGMYLG